MITVLPVRCKKEIEELCLANNVEINENSGVVVARENDIVCGYCFYYMDSKSIVIDKLLPTNDIFLADGILRSALHVAVCNNIMNAFYNLNAPEELFEKLKFIVNKQEKRLNINKLFESCCSCGDKKT